MILRFVAVEDPLQPLQFVAFAVVPDGRGQRVVNDVGEFAMVLADVLDVAVGAGDVAALGPAVVGVRGDQRVVDGAAQLAKRLGGIEDAGHPVAVVDLQELVAQQVAGLTVAGEDVPGELAASGDEGVSV